MDRVKLKSTLSTLKIPKDSYSIDNVEDDSLCLVFDGFIWRVFYSERGHRIEPEYFSDEEAACEAFLLRIKKWF